MAINYRYYKDKHYLLSKVEGQLTLAEVLSYFDKIINDTEIDSPFFEIVDFSNISKFDFGYYETNQLMAKLNHLKSINNYQGPLLIADNNYLLGMTNIFKTVGEDKDININIVKSLDEAIGIFEEHFA